MYMIDGWDRLQLPPGDLGLRIRKWMNEWMNVHGNSDSFYIVQITRGLEVNQQVSVNASI